MTVNRFVPLCFNCRIPCTSLHSYGIWKIGKVCWLLLCVCVCMCLCMRLSMCMFDVCVVCTLWCVVFPLLRSWKILLQKLFTHLYFYTGLMQGWNISFEVQMIDILPARISKCWLRGSEELLRDLKSVCECLTFPARCEIVLGSKGNYH